MGWKGAIRSIAAAQRRREREALRHYKELERQQASSARMQERERVAYEVAVYENYIDLLLSVHKECSDPWNWKVLATTSSPKRPIRSSVREGRAQTHLDAFRPSPIGKLFGGGEAKRRELVQAIEQAKKEDEQEFQAALQRYTKEYSEWEEQQDLAKRVLANDPAAFVEVIQEVNPFSDIKPLGSGASVNVTDENPTLMTVKMDVNSEKAIPNIIKSVLKTGKLSVKEMPKGRFYELYQDYVCACLLRMARELFALLPLEMVIATAVGEVLNNVSST